MAKAKHTQTASGSRPATNASGGKGKGKAPYPKAKPTTASAKGKAGGAGGKAEQPKAGGKAGQPKAGGKAGQPKAGAAKGKGKAQAEHVREEIPIPTLKPSGPSTSSSFKLIVGSYEKNLYGLKGTLAIDSDSGAVNASLEPIFIFPAHLATIKCVAASPGGKWLATGSEDEIVKVWDLRRRKEVGGLSQHQGSITSLYFPTKSHLVSSSDDSTLSLFRVRDWALLRSLKGHSGRINGFDVHPTGRVALSVGKDKTLKMWDLMRGRGAASLALGREAEQVKFSPLGTHFAVLSPQLIEIYSLDMVLLDTLETKRRFHDIKFASYSVDEHDTEVLLVATEEGNVDCFTVEVLVDDEPEDDTAVKADKQGDEGADEDEDEGPKTVAIVEKIATFGGHANRVKSISTLELYLPESTSKTTLIASCSSDGKINVHNLAAAVGGAEADIQPIASYDTEGSRLICVTLADDAEPAETTEAPVADDDVEAGARFEDDEDDEGMYEDSQDEDEDEDELELEAEDEDEIEED